MFVDSLWTMQRTKMTWAAKQSDTDWFKVFIGLLIWLLMKTNSRFTMLCLNACDERIFLLSSDGLHQFSRPSAVCLQTQSSRSVFNFFGDFFFVCKEHNNLSIIIVINLCLTIQKTLGSRSVHNIKVQNCNPRPCRPRPCLECLYTPWLYCCCFLTQEANVY